VPLFGEAERLQEPAGGVVEVVRSGTHGRVRVGPKDVVDGERDGLCSVALPLDLGGDPVGEFRPTPVDVVDVDHTDPVDFAFVRLTGPRVRTVETDDEAVTAVALGSDVELLLIAHRTPHRVSDLGIGAAPLVERDVLRFQRAERDALAFLDSWTWHGKRDSAEPNTLCVHSGDGEADPDGDRGIAFLLPVTSTTMRKVAIDEVEPDPADEDYQSDRRALTGPLNLQGVALSRYVLEPGERFSGSVHAHADQEEVFLVVSGTATFETTAGDELGNNPREVTAEAGEAVRFAPGEFQTGRNADDEPLVAFALGAPRDSEDVRISRIPVLDDRDVSCPDCGRGDMRIAHDGDGNGGEGDSDGDDGNDADADPDFVCPDCGGTLDAP